MRKAPLDILYSVSEGAFWRGRERGMGKTAKARTVHGTICGRKAAEICFRQKSTGRAEAELE